MDRRPEDSGFEEPMEDSLRPEDLPTERISSGSSSEEDPLDRVMAGAFGPSKSSPNYSTSPDAGQAPYSRRRSAGAPHPEKAERFRVGDELSRGGMGVIYHAVDADIGRPVALKVLDERLSRSSEMQQRFVEEAQIGGQLQHPGVVPVYERGVLADGRPFFAMKLVEGRTLRDLLKDRGPPSEDHRRFLDVFEKICQTLAYAHSRGVIHRDLKPSNIMVGAFGEVQVMDWGLAKVQGRSPSAAPTGMQSLVPLAPLETVRSEGDSHPSQTGAVMGTPAYMPPEQARGEIDRVSPRSDVFGLGALLLEILTGFPPYTGATPLEVRQACERADLTAAFERLRTADADRELLELTARCLAADPGERPTDARVLARELRAHLEGTQERARAAELAAATAKATAAQEVRARRLTLTLAVFIVLIVLVVAAAVLLQSRARDKRSQVVRQSLARATTEAQDLWSTARLQEPIDLALWARTLDAVRKVQELAASEDADPEARAATKELMEKVATEAGTARSLHDERKRDREMVGKLDAIASRISTVIEVLARIPAYEEALAEYGINPEVSLPVAVRTVVESSIRGRITQAVDDLLLVRRAAAPEGSWLLWLRVAQESDSDPTRRGLRDAWAKNQVDDVEALISRVYEGASVRTVRLAAGFLEWFGREKQAIALLRRALARTPDSPELLFNLGLLLRSDPKSDPAELIRLWSAIAAFQPTAWAPKLHLAEAFRVSGNLSAALAALYEALKIDPRATDVLRELAHDLLAAGHLDIALPIYAELVSQDECDLQDRRGLGATLMGLNRLQEAVRVQEEALALEPDDVRLHANLAIALGRSGREADALRHFQRVTELAPNAASSWLDLALYAKQHQNFSTARTHLLKARALDPDLAAVPTVLGEMALLEGSPEEAEDLLLDAIRLNPQGVLPYQNLGALWRRTGRLEDARNVLRKAVQLTPDSPDTQASLLEILFELGAYDEALEVARHLHDPDSPDVASWLERHAEALELVKDLDAVLANTRRAMPEDLVRLATWAHRKGRYADATTLWSRAFEADPSLAKSLLPRLTPYAASSALLAGGAERRELVLAWLTEDLGQLQERFEADRLPRTVGRAVLHGYRTSKDLEGVRNGVFLAELPAAARSGWMEFWRQVHQLQALLQ